VQKSTGLNKDGSPDKRLNENKQSKVQTPLASAQTTIALATSTKTQAAPSTTTTKTAYLASCTDSKGRTIYTRPKGGLSYVILNNVYYQMKVK